MCFHIELLIESFEVNGQQRSLSVISRHFLHICTSPAHSILSPVEEDFSDNDLADIFGKSEDEDDFTSFSYILLDDIN